ncbi:hypothetical protein PAXRUDRAFT_160634 [Paxillus rubicundulus Ve08.2h10]|uniref:Uncharacterized protein n=1 Tax=Paxillus rubicundulus Ve08.2h10 TaxID=930991 RepID=A0A0D0D7K2_9AGAM|nr:hypothetical protein PAXRUDRAFT_160634 [Paxillus rubicundulus Ve08.2h10]
MKAYTMATQRHADGMHDPGSSTKAPGSHPPRIGLEGEKDKALSLYVESMDIDMDDTEVAQDQGDLTVPRDCVGIHHPNGPTEPPDEKEGG